jgi:hypothetical protein
MILAPKVCSARPVTGRALTVGTIVNQRMGGGKPSAREALARSITLALE